MKSEFLLFRIGVKSSFFWVRIYKIRVKDIKRLREFVNFGVDLVELPREIGRVEELAVIEAIVVGRIGLGEIGRRYDRHFMTVNCILDEEELHLVGDLEKEPKNLLFKLCLSKKDVVKTFVYLILIYF